MSLPTFTTLGSGPTVLMLHGILGGHLAFAPQVETLASSGYRAVAWDMPGYGHSPPIEPYNFKGLAARCIALIDSLACGHVTLVGQGMGGMVAQEVVARRPELVDKLLLAATTAQVEPQGDTAELQAVQLAQRVGPAALPEGVRLAQHCMNKVNPATYRRAQEALAGFDRSASLPLIHVPTLLLAGEHDREAPPATMKQMAAAIPGSTFLELAGVGHLLNLEAPDEFDSALLNFLALPRILH